MEYVSEVISFLAGLFTGGIAVRWSVNRSKKQVSTQHANKAGGDIAGRDIHKR